MIPTEMETLLRQILENTEKVYLPQASRIYQMRLAASEPLPLSTLASFGELEKDEDYAFLLPIMEVDERYLFARSVQARKRISARCQDLLEFVTTATDLVTDHKVIFIHRTIRGFLLKPDIDHMLRGWSGHFQIHDNLSKLLVLDLKLSPQRYRQARIRLVKEMLYQVQLQEIKGRKLPRRMMEEIECLARKDGVLPGFECSDSHIEFVQRAIEQGLTSYIQENRYEVRHLIQTNGYKWENPPLAALLFPGCRSCARCQLNRAQLRHADYIVTYRTGCCKVSGDQKYELASEINVGVVRLLLELGANPNQRMPRESDDESLVRKFYSAVDRIAVKASHETRSKWAQVMELLVSHGGDVNGLVFQRYRLHLGRRSPFTGTSKTARVFSVTRRNRRYSSISSGRENDDSGNTVSVYSRRGTWKWYWPLFRICTRLLGVCILYGS